MSAKGAAFIRRHEGFVSKAYRDPVGIVTIGTGFTNRSKTAREWWQRTRGHEIRMGDRITREENDQLLAAAIKHEYGAPVSAALGKAAPQHALDAGTSVSFNCGPGSLKWSWAKFYKSGRRSDAARRLKTTAVTARGRRLAGLVRRRKEEADLLLNGRYGPLDIPASRFGDGDPASSAVQAHDDTQTPKLFGDAQLKQDQELLNAIGYPCGRPDGLWGAKTKAAVIRVQRDHGLKVDGILGPATRAKIVRLANARRDAKIATATSTTPAGAGIASTDVSPYADWMIAGGVLLLVAGAAYLAWFYRDELSTFLRRL